jgi:ankyrin repeat protein
MFQAAAFLSAVPRRLAPHKPIRTVRSLAANYSFARAAAWAVLGFTLSAPTGCVPGLGSRHLYLRRNMATRAWSRCSSPPALPSPTRPTAGMGRAGSDGRESSDPVSRVRGRWTSLMYSARNGHTRVVEMLIAAGADLHSETNSGYCVWPDSTASSRRML